MSCRCARLSSKWTFRSLWWYESTASCIPLANDFSTQTSIDQKLGKYPEFVEDAANAIKWVRDNIGNLGGDLQNVFLSGHSAGGHIASLLILRHSKFLAPVGIPVDFFRGLVLVSGVYDLFSPLRSAPLDAKNKWFVLAYVLPAFGSDEQTRREASPLLLLDPKKETSVLGSIALSITRRYSQLSSKQFESTDQLDECVDVDVDGSMQQDESDETTEDGDKKEDPADNEKTVNKNDIELNTRNIPPVLIMNAGLYDMGLDDNGEKMARQLERYTRVKYVLIPGADHASICWSDFTASEVTAFLQNETKRRNGVKSKSLRRGRVRRDKRDKMPMYNENDE